MTFGSPKWLSIKQLANRYPSYSFRKKIVERKEGFKVVQMKDVGEHDILWPKLSCTHLEGTKKPEFLKPGDLLILAKGARHLALIVPKTVSDGTLCTSHFHHFRLSVKRVDPHFIALMLNHPKIQNQLHIKAAGITTKHLKAEAVENVRIPLPDPKTQAHFVGLASNLNTQRHVIQQLIQNGTTLMNHLTNQLLQSPT